MTLWDANNISLHGQGCAHDGTSDVRLQDDLGRHINDHDRVDDCDGGDDGQHHGEEEREAEVLFTPLRWILQLRHVDFIYFFLGKVQI